MSQRTPVREDVGLSRHWLENQKGRGLPKKVNLHLP